MTTENNDQQVNLTEVGDKVVDQKTIVKKKDRALLLSLAIFALVIAGVAVAGILSLKPAEETIQGQADCETTRVSGKLPGRIVKFYVKEGDYVHKGDKLVSIYSSTVDENADILTEKETIHISESM